MSVGVLQRSTEREANMKRTLLSLVVVIMGACSPSSTPSAPAAGATKASAPTVKALIRNITFQGELCAPNQSTHSLSPDKDAFTAILSSPVTHEAVCRIFVDFDVPAGFSMTGPRFVLRGFGEGARLTTTYSYAGAAGAPQTLAFDVTGEFAREQKLRSFPTPSCNGDTQMHLVIETVATVSDGGHVQLDSVDGDTLSDFGIDWERCNLSGGGGAGGAGGGAGGAGGGSGGDRCDFSCDDFNYTPGQCFKGFFCDARGCLNHTGCVSSDRCDFACEDFGYAPGQCFEGFFCDFAGCLNETGCE
jgi:hypothetical protein